MDINYDLVLTIFQIISSALGVASTVAGLTETKEDDIFIKKLIDFVSFLTPKNTSGTFKLPLTKPKDA